MSPIPLAQAQSLPSGLDARPKRTPSGPLVSTMAISIRRLQAHLRQRPWSWLEIMTNQRPVFLDTDSK